MSEPRLNTPDGIMLTWKAESFRSEATARVFGLDPFYIAPPARAGKLAKALFYPRAMVRTLMLLAARRPKAVFCMNQPAFLPIACAAHSLLTGAPVIMDFHSGALTNPVWRPFRRIYRSLVRRAPFTLCHNDTDAEQIRAWGGQPVRTICLPIGLDAVARRPAPERPRLLVCCSFAPDEPIRETLEAMRDCPEIHFEMTGNFRKSGLSPELVPGNVTLLGFLPYADYLDRMAASTAVLTLSDRPHIMQMAVHEALALGVPVLTNRSATLEAVLEGAGVFCQISRDGIARGAREIAARADALRAITPIIRQRRLDELSIELDRARALSPQLFNKGL
jgi:glycosyltransferase involved in cell wall biosynthesis